MMTLAEFHSLVSSDLGRGTGLDSVIPLRVKLAVQFLERNYTFQYMKRWHTFSVNASAENPHVISLAGYSPKRITTIRRISEDDDGTIRYHPLNGPIDPRDRTTRPEGFPTAWSLNGLANIILDATPDEDFDLEIHGAWYTAWGTANSFTHWLLDHAVGLLLPLTLMYMSSRTRDPKNYAMYEKQFALELKTFNVAEEEIQLGSVEDEMIFTPLGGEVEDYEPGRDT